MKKTLRVIEPFFVMDTGDTFEYNEDTKMYVSKHSEDFYKTHKGSVDEIKSSYNSEFQISAEYADELIKEGYLEVVNTEAKQFVNIFDEIDNLLNKYKQEIQNIDEDMATLPSCVKVEREAVLTNLVTLLEHLKGLKK